MDNTFFAFENQGRAQVCCFGRHCPRKTLAAKISWNPVHAPVDDLVGLDLSAMCSWPSELKVRLEPCQQKVWKFKQHKNIGWSEYFPYRFAKEWVLCLQNCDSGLFDSGKVVYIYVMKYILTAKNLDNWFLYTTHSYLRHRLTLSLSLLLLLSLS